MVVPKTIAPGSHCKDSVGVPGTSTHFDRKALLELETRVRRTGLIFSGVQTLGLQCKPTVTGCSRERKFTRCFQRGRAFCCPSVCQDDAKLWGRASDAARVPAQRHGRRGRRPAAPQPLPARQPQERQHVPLRLPPQLVCAQPRVRRHRPAGVAHLRAFLRAHRAGIEEGVQLLGIHGSALGAGVVCRPVAAAERLGVAACVGGRAAVAARREP